jgi:trk system potassium uptake protein TrkA
MKDWIGKTIQEKGIRTNYHMSILAIKENNQVFPIPKPDYMFTGNEHLIVIGKKNEILKFK